MIRRIAVRTPVLKIELHRGIITGSYSFKRHNLVNIRFIYIKFLINIAEGMLSLQI